MPANVDFTSTKIVNAKGGISVPFTPFSYDEEGKSNPRPLDFCPPEPTDSDGFSVLLISSAYAS